MTPIIFLDADVLVVLSPPDGRLGVRRRLEAADQAKVMEERDELVGLLVRKLVAARVLLCPSRSRLPLPPWFITWMAERLARAYVIPRTCLWDVVL